MSSRIDVLPSGGLEPAWEEGAKPAGLERRVPALDGLRGTATIMVVVSHYFGELAHGIRAVMFGWIAVDIFFVLSGYLIGKLILERCDSRNFFAVFYVRRFCRIVPAYLLMVLVVGLLVKWIGQPWTNADVQFPLWSYLTFTQTFFMSATDAVGAHWLGPTWTLALEEHFYLVIPAAIVFTPRRLLVPFLIAAAASALGLRVLVYQFGLAHEMAALTMLPARADILVCGLLAAIAMVSNAVPWPRLMPVLRLVPLAALAAVFLLRSVNVILFDICGPLLIAIGCACFLLGIVQGAPEARRFDSRILRFFGNNSYCLYLVHLPILGLMHGIFLHTRPDLATWQQWLVTLCALPLSVFVGWGMTRLIEEPLTRYGRSWRWSREMRGTKHVDRDVAAVPVAESF